MRVGLTGWNGFLATKLRERTEVEWVDGTENTDMLLHLGGPTFTAAELFEHDAQVMHQYVRESIKLFDRYPGPIIFGSTTGVNDIQLDHGGTTSYNLSKLFLENYLINNTDKWCVLRIGTIVSEDPKDIDMMKPDRLQQRIKQGNYSYIEMKDHYLYVNSFVDVTMDKILNFKNEIVEYPLQELKLPQLIKMSR